MTISVTGIIVVDAAESGKLCKWCHNEASYNIENFLRQLRDISNCVTWEPSNIIYVCD